MAAEPRRFVVLFNGRTGSTFLMDALRADRRVVARMERFAMLKDEGAAAQLAWARRFYTRRRSEHVCAVGFKAKPFDVLDRRGFGGLLRELGVRIVHMRRRNLVRVAVSAINAERLYEATGEWNTRDPEAVPGPFEVDLAELRRWISATTRADEALAAYIDGVGQPSLDLWYEDLIARDDAALGALGRFLGAEIDATILDGADTQRVTPPDLRDALTNFDQVARALAGTPHEAMLHQDG